MTDNLPMPDHGGQTICVSPFAGRQEICPGRKHEANDDNPTLDSPNTQRRRWQQKDFYVTINRQTFHVSRENIIRGLHAFFPPPQEVLRSYYRQGQMDTIAFLKAQGWWEGAGFEEEGAEGVSEDDVLIKGVAAKGVSSAKKC